jgi:PiT family inorganic phosphate transporter
MFRLLSGVYLGWGLGANDAANVFGTGVASRAVPYRAAVILTAVFVLAGAYFEGSRGMHTIGALTRLTMNSALVASLAAAVIVNVLTLLAFPVSTTQAIIGAMLAAGVIARDVNLGVLTKILLSWILNPIGAGVISYGLYRLLGPVVEERVRDVRSWSLMLRIGFYGVGIYGAYALGANNVANTTGVYFNAGMLSARTAAVVGGLAIGLGVITYSRRVMMTVGERITRLSEFAALIAILGQDISVHVFAWVGVPVSASQAIVGAVIGVGFVKSSRAINFRMVWRIVVAWICTPTAAFLLAYAMLRVWGALGS